MRAAPPCGAGTGTGTGTTRFKTADSAGSPSPENAHPSAGTPSRSSIDCAHATLADGGPPCRNRGLHVVKLRWFKIIEMDVYPGTDALRTALDRQAATGIEEADDEPIASCPGTPRANHRRQ